MKLLIQDMLRRWWPLAGIIMVVALASTMARCPIILSMVVFLALLSDTRNGFPQVAQTLPVTKRVIAMSRWFSVVMMMPLLVLPILPLGVALEMPDPVLKKIGTLANQPWFGAAAEWWLQLGFGAFLFLLYIAASEGLSVRYGKKLGQAASSMVIAFSSFANLWLIRLVPGRLEATDFLQWTLIALTPVMVLLSALVAWRSDRRPSPPARHEPPLLLNGFTPGKYHGHGLTGMPMLVLKMHGFSLGIYGVMVLVTWMIALLTGRSQMMQNLMKTDQQTVMFMVMISGIMIPNSWSLRMLRTLPLSTWHLTWLLLSVPISLGLCSAGLAAAFGIFGSDPGTVFFQGMARAAGLAGMGGLMLASACWNTRFYSYLLFLFMVIPSIAISSSWVPAMTPFTVIALGMVATACAFIFLRLVLDRSSKAYGPRWQWGVKIDSAAMSR